jgi:hypothetical protein
MPRIACGFWRRVLVCALAYALALQGLIIASDTAEAGVGTPGDAALSEFVLCSHSGAGATLPGAPSQVPVGDSHCIFCIVGAVYVHSAPPAVPQLLGAVLADRVTPLAAQRLLAFFVNQSAWPRGPPAAA